MKKVTYDELINGLIGAVAVVFLITGIVGMIDAIPPIFVYAIAATATLTAILVGAMVCCIQPFIGKLKQRFSRHVHG